MKYHFTYKTTNLVNGKYYYGVHNTNNLNDGYLGSGKLLKKAIRKYGRANFSREILEFFDSDEAAFESESYLVTQKEVDNDNCYNTTLGGFGNPGLRGIATGSIVINNGKDTKFVKPQDLDEYLANGWVKGILIEYTPLGKITINKDGVRKMVTKDKLDEYLANGWKKGGVTGVLVWINNGVDYKQINVDKLDEYLNSGWKKGRMQPVNKNYIWIVKNNIEKRVSPSKLDEYLNNGWESGRKKGMKPTTLDRIKISKNNDIKYVKPEDLQKYMDDGWIKYKLSPECKEKFSTKGTTWVNDGNTTILINKHDLDEYLNKGWIRGNLNYSTLGRKLINNGRIEKYVPKEDLDEYLNKGWVLGQIKNKNKCLYIKTKRTSK